MNRLFAHADVLPGVQAIARRGGEIAERAVAVANVEISAARSATGVPLVIAEDGIHRGEVTAERRLGDEENDRSAACRI